MKSRPESAKQRINLPERPWNYFPFTNYHRVSLFGFGFMETAERPRNDSAALTVSLIQVVVFCATVLLHRRFSRPPISAKETAVHSINASLPRLSKAFFPRHPRLPFANALITGCRFDQLCNDPRFHSRSKACVVGA